MPALLFVCTQNRFRSPLAAAMFCQCLEKDGVKKGWRVASAGTWTTAGTAAHPAALQVARKLGLSLSSHQTRPVSAALLSWADLVVVMERGHLEAIHIEFEQARGKVHLLSEIVDGTSYDVPDTIGSDGEQTFRLGKEVCELVERAYPRICDLARQMQSNKKADSSDHQ